MSPLFHRPLGRIISAFALTAAMAWTQPATAATPDFTGLTEHPGLYIDSTDVSPKTLKRPNCTVRPGSKRPARDVERPSGELGLGSPATLDAQYENQRFSNFIPNARQAAVLPTEWKPELAEVPTAAGTYEVSIHPCEVATAEQGTQAQALLEKSLESARRHGWFSHEKALAAGYRLEHHGEHVHYVNPDYLTDGEILSPDKPEFLVFFEEDGKPELAGFMYVMEGVRDRGPQIGGPLTVWHYHVTHPMCMKDGLTSGMPGPDGACANGELTTRSPEMLHTWFWKRQDGPFSSDMTPPKR